MVKAMANRIGKMLMAIHKDEQGADMVEYILIFAAISLPLVAVIIWFWKDISAWAGQLWSNTKSGATSGDPGTDPSGLGH